MGQPWEWLAVPSAAAGRLFNPQTVKENTVSKSASTSSVYRVTELIGTSDSYENRSPNNRLCYRGDFISTRW